MPIVAQPACRWAPELPAEQWQDELHPDWCDGDGSGCGIHYGPSTGIEASSDNAGFGDRPTFWVAPVMDSAGQVGVNVCIEGPGRYGTTKLALGEAVQAAWALLAAVRVASGPTGRHVRHVSPC